MKYKAILFDLDGTLLPMDLDSFKNMYFTMLVKSIAKHGYEPKGLMSAILDGIGAMFNNDGERTNERAFFDAMERVYGDKIYSDIKYFEEFYEKEFDLVRASVGFNSDADKVIKELKSMGYRLILATNPVFPKVATLKRMEWAGLSACDFELITTYEISRFSKPALGYFKEILERLELRADECLMVGNDTSDDISCADLGMDVFLVTDDLINEKGIDISTYPNGKLTDIYALLV